jgi:adenine-specific DNA-methyltransferase
LLLRRIGIETSNLYTGFLATAIKLIEPGGQLVAITPRSFCNGPYFLPFRKQLLSETALRRVHIFESRTRAFKDDSVLQENVIFHVVKGGKPGIVEVTSSPDATSKGTSRRIAHEQIVKPEDRQFFIHIVADHDGEQVAERINGLNCSLHDLGLAVSTGRVVDFRARQFLRQNAEPGTAPLIYPTHFRSGFVSWPKKTKKPNALVMSAETADLLIPNDNYVLVKRFSSKEERKRIVAVVHAKNGVDSKVVGFENHVNYFHQNGKGISLTVAKGLACFLNWTVVDSFFRQFNGHTQVNATDLRSFRYPTVKQLETIGKRIGNAFPEQAELDGLVDKEVS